MPVLSMDALQSSTSNPNQIAPSTVNPHLTMPHLLPNVSPALSQVASPVQRTPPLGTATIISDLPVSGVEKLTTPELTRSDVGLNQVVPQSTDSTKGSSILTNGDARPTVEVPSNVNGNPFFLSTLKTGYLLTCT